MTVDLRQLFSALVSLWFLVISIACGQIPDMPQGERPGVYASTFPQLFVEGWPDPRQVTVLRLGTGPGRKAEYWVFEFVREAQRLRRLHRTTLRNEYAPLEWHSADHGRFLVTYDERDRGHGTVDNCLVIYDLVRGVCVSRKAKDFLPENKLQSDGWPEEVWRGARTWIDPSRQMLFPTGPEECREYGKLFLTIDLPSLTVRHSAVAPDRLSAVAYPSISGHATEWKWSMGRDAETEPAWDAVFALPKYLKGTAVWGLDRLRPMGIEREVMYFKLDSASGDYMRCPDDEWIDAPESWGKRQSLR